MFCPNHLIQSKKGVWPLSYFQTISLNYPLFPSSTKHSSFNKALFVFGCDMNQRLRRGKFTGVGLLVTRTHTQKQTMTSVFVTQPLKKPKISFFLENFTETTAGKVAANEKPPKKILYIFLVWEGKACERTAGTVSESEICHKAFFRQGALPCQRYVKWRLDSDALFLMCGVEIEAAIWDWK